MLQVMQMLDDRTKKIIRDLPDEQLGKLVIATMNKISRYGGIQNIDTKQKEEICRIFLKDLRYMVAKHQGIVIESNDEVFDFVISMAKTRPEFN